MTQYIVPGVGNFDDSIPAGQYIVPGIGNLAGVGAGDGSVTVGLSGTTLTHALGSLAIGAALAISGQSLTQSQGTVTPTTGSNVSVSLSGQNFSHSTGTLVVARSLSVSGQSFSYSSGTVAATTGGIYTSSPLENNTGSGPLTSVTVYWTWWQGSIGSTPTSLTHGSSTTNGSGVFTASGLPTGAGFMIARDSTGAYVYYEPGTI